MSGFRGLLREEIEKTFKKRRGIYPKFFLKEPSVFIDFPESIDLTKIDVKYPLLEPLSAARIKWDPVKKGVVYYTIEPLLSKREIDLLDKIKADLTELIDVEISSIRSREQSITYMEGKVKNVLEDNGISLTPDEYVKIMYFIIRDFVGFNEIDPLLHDPYIEDIGCDGLNVPIYIVHRKFGSIETAIIYNNADYLENFVIKLSERCGRYVSYAKPLLDGSLPDGSRIQASLAKDVTTRGPTFSIRKFRSNPISPTKLIEMKTASVPMMAYMWLAIQHSSSILICGGVATGKTTFLNAITMFIPPEEKIVSIEDTRELNLTHQNWIPSVSRSGFGAPDETGERYGEVTLFDLLKESFRQNPDYVIVGEVRGQEASVMFQGMASGHACIGTIHAGSIDDVVRRLETPPISLSPTLVETLDLLVVMVHAKEKTKSSRRTKEIVEVETIDPNSGKAVTVKAFSWLPSSDTFDENIGKSQLLRKISFEKGISYENLMKDFENRKRILEWMLIHDIKDFREVGEIINLFYKDHKTVMGWVDANMPPVLGIKRMSLEESATGLRIIDE